MDFRGNSVGLIYSELGQNVSRGIILDEYESGSFQFNFCPEHDFQTVKAINWKLYTLMELMNKSNAQEP